MLRDLYQHTLNLLRNTILCASLSHATMTVTMTVLRNKKCNMLSMTMKTTEICHHVLVSGNQERQMTKAMNPQALSSHYLLSILIRFLRPNWRNKALEFPL